MTTKQDYKIVIDTREQRPVFPINSKGVVHKGLKVGDYSIEGHEEQFAIERKSPSDLVGTLTSGHKRFKKELEKALKYKYFAILVEAPYTDIIDKQYDGAYHSKTKGYVITSILFTLHMKYGINVFFALNRVEARRIIRELSKAYLKNHTHMRDNK